MLQMAIYLHEQNDGHSRYTGHDEEDKGTKGGHRHTIDGIEHQRDYL